jgi:hypothetical protein
MQRLSVEEQVFGAGCPTSQADEGSGSELSKYKKIVPSKPGRSTFLKMLAPTEKREVVDYILKGHGGSIHQACRSAGMH